MKKKKKNINTGGTLKRPERLSRAKKWMGVYTGKNFVRGYAKHFRVDLLCAIRELRILGVAVSDEYEKKIKCSVSDRALQKQKKKEMAQYNMEDYWDEPFAFEIGFSSGGTTNGAVCKETFLPPDTDYQIDFNTEPDNDSIFK